MKLNDDIFKELEKFHLSSYEIKAYSSLLMNGPMKTLDIIKETGIPQPRVYDVIGKLEKRGLVVLNSSLKKSYEAVLPGQAFKKEIQNMERYVEQLDRFVQYNRKNVKLESPNVWFIENDMRTASKLLEYIKNAKFEILISVPEQKIRELLPTLRKVSSNGVTVCSVVDEGLGETLVNSLSNIGVCKVRNVPPAEIVIVDREISFINVKSISLTSDYSVFIQEDELVDVVSYYFFYMNWQPSVFRKDFKTLRTVKFVTSWLALEAIEELRNEGHNLIATVKGYSNGREVNVKGKIVSYVRDAGVRQAFSMESEDKILTVGGKNGKLEDIKMTELTLNVSKEPSA